MEKNNEFSNFDRVMRKLIKVPHTKIKAELDREKAEKTKRKPKKPSASGRASGDKG